MRGHYGFEGIVVTDWGLLNSRNYPQPLVAIAWGVEDLTPEERIVRIIEAGCDQFGGQANTDMVVGLVKNGSISEDRIDVSVRRLLREKFLLGLFENPYTDPAAAERVVGNDYFMRVGKETQRRAYTLLTNKNETLPLRGVTPATKFYVEGIDETYMAERNLTVVKTPGEADYALVRLESPTYPRGNGTLDVSFASGSLEFTPQEKKRQAAIYSAVPTIVDVVLNRAAVIPEIAGSAAALFGSYGSDSGAFLDVVLGSSAPEGKLPFDLPRSMEAVEEQMEDVPFDTRGPLFKFGHGLRYPSPCGEKKCQA